jgi:acetylornithine/succinyldiaminopimelate/putrescine aminotransferase
MQILDKLEMIRGFAGQAITRGLSDDIINRFAEIDDSLVEAVDEAVIHHLALREDYGDLLASDEPEQTSGIQERLINFYSADCLNPYVSLAARGPWIVTSMGAVIHDSGGYGMLGFGHAPEDIIHAMGRPHVMANVMTANFSQIELIDALRREIGHTRSGDNEPYARFLCLNSGSESVTMGARISDVNAKLQTDPGGRHEGKTIKVLSLQGGFHGRTDRPAQFSDSTARAYRDNLATFRDRDNLLTVVPNDLDGLREIFARAESEGVFIESFFMEPVMGEGNPGQAIDVEFYRLARELTLAHGSLLLIDSIQAGLRAHGCLSIVDYPGFENEAPPDMEAYSKALNAGQYPLSVLAMTERASALYRGGIYGNTMTTNPRAMDVAVAVLHLLDDEVRENIRQRGREFIEKLEALKTELAGKITKVQGTGLLFSCEMSSEYKAYGKNSLEDYMRKHGIGVIHGGENSLRFTPHFRITSEEVDLLIDATRDALINGPRKEHQEPMAQAG